MSDPQLHNDGSPLCQSGGFTVHPSSKHSGFSPCWNRARYLSYEGIYLCGRHLRYAGQVTALAATGTPPR